MHLIDTHCHLDTPVLMDELELVLEKAKKGGVKKFIVPGYIASGWNKIAAICKDHPSTLFPAFGLHPMYMNQHNLSVDLELLRHLCNTVSPVAIGEIGIDFQRGKQDETEQRTLFTQQLKIAHLFGLPVLLHVRKAHDQALSIIRKTGFNNGGIVHAFNGSMQQAQQYLQHNFKLGYGGNLTYDRAKRIRTLASELNLDAIVLETDAPDIPLSHRRDDPNSPEFLPEILAELARLRPESTDDIARKTTENAYKVIPLLKNQKNIR